MQIKIFQNKIAIIAFQIVGYKNERLFCVCVSTVFLEHPVTKFVMGTRRLIVFKNFARYRCAILVLHHHEVGLVHPSLLHYLNVEIENLGLGQWLFFKFRLRCKQGL